MYLLLTLVALLIFIMNIHVPKEARRQFSIDVKSKLVERALSVKAQWEEERDKLPAKRVEQDKKVGTKTAIVGLC